MTQPNANLFPDNIACVAVDLATPGAETKDIFEFREGVVRAISAFNFLSASRSANEPNAPSKWDFWITPAVLSPGGALSKSNVKVFNGAGFVDVTPTLFARAIVEKGGGRSLPDDALGFLRNDGAGGLSWDNGSGLVNTILNASGNIAIDGAYDITDLTLVNNVTLNALSGFPPNKPHLVRIRQGVGGFVVSLNAAVFKLGILTPTWSTGGGAIDVMGFVSRTGAVAEVVMQNKGVQ